MDKNRITCTGDVTEVNGGRPNNLQGENGDNLEEVVASNDDDVHIASNSGEVVNDTDRGADHRSEEEMDNADGHADNTDQGHSTFVHNKMPILYSKKGNVLHVWTMKGIKKMRIEGNQDVSTADSQVDSTSQRDEPNRKTSVPDTWLSVQAELEIGKCLADGQYLQAVSISKAHSGSGIYSFILENLLKLSEKPYCFDLNETLMCEALSQVLHWIDGKEYHQKICGNVVLEHVRFMHRHYPRSRLLHTILNTKGLDKNSFLSALFPRTEEFLCRMLREIRSHQFIPRWSFELSRIFAIYVEAAGPPLHYGKHYDPGDALLSCSGRELHETVFSTAVKLNLYEEALLLYCTGAVSYKELQEIHEEEKSKGHWSLLNQCSPMPEFLESVIHTPRSLFLTCTLEVASLIKRKPERAEALRGRLPQPLIDVVMFKPQLEHFEDEIMKRSSCLRFEKIFKY